MYRLWTQWVFRTFRLNAEGSRGLVQSGRLSFKVLLPADLMDQSSASAAVKQAEPDEAHNLFAQSFMGAPHLCGPISQWNAFRFTNSNSSRR